MGNFPDDDRGEPPDQQRQPENAETQSFEEELGASVVSNLRQESTLKIWYDGDRVQIDPLERRSERERTSTEASSPQDRDSDKEGRNRKMASNLPSSATTTTTERAGSTDRQSQSGGLNGELNVQNLTEKQAKAYLLLEVTGGEISASELAERAGYSSKGGAHNAQENWKEDRSLAEGG